MSLTARGNAAIDEVERRGSIALSDVLAEEIQNLHRGLVEIAAWDTSRTLGYEGPRDIARRALGLKSGPEVEVRF